MRIYEINRKSRIERIRAGIKSARLDKKEVDMKKLLLYIMEEYGVSLRTAKEYIDVANNFEKEEEAEHGALG